jgi:hypothetical protein
MMWSRGTYDLHVLCKIPCERLSPPLQKQDGLGIYCTEKISNDSSP